MIGGDIIVAANGTPVTSESQLRDVIETMKPGDKLALRIWQGRQGEDRPREAGSVHQADFEKKIGPLQRLGPEPGGAV